MRRWILALLIALALGLLGLLFWELEYQHVSLVLWLLVAVAVLWSCAQIAVSLHLYPVRQQRRTRMFPQKRSRRSEWAISLGGVVVLTAFGVLLWREGFETISHLLWFLAVVVLLWCCTRVSLFLQPHGQPSGRWARPQMQWSESLFPGSSLRSGYYHEDDAEVWDGNEKLPPH